jgi:hypothetical protein
MTLFDRHTFGPGSDDRVIERPARPSKLRRLCALGSRARVAGTVVVMLGAVAIASVVFVFWLLVGAGIAPMIDG